MTGDSVKQYKQSAIDANTNKGWPLTYGTDNKTGWQVQQTGYNALFPTVDYTKTAQWNQKLTSDPILNYGSTSTDLGGVSDTLNVLTTVMGGVTAITGLLGLGSSIAALCKKDSGDGSDNDFSKKENKEIKKHTNDTKKTEAALSRNIETAESVNENTKPETVQKIVSNLISSVGTATTQKNDAILEKETATNTKATLEDEKTEIKAQIGGYQSEIATLTAKINDLEKTDTSNMTTAQKKEHKANLSQAKDDLKKAEKNKEKAEEDLRKKEREINVQQTIIDQNTETITTLGNQIETANKLINKLNNKTGNPDK